MEGLLDVCLSLPIEMRLSRERIELTIKIISLRALYLCEERMNIMLSQNQYSEVIKILFFLSLKGNYD